MHDRARLPLKQLRKCLEFCDCSHKTLLHEILQILIYAKGRIFQAAAHLLHRTAEDARCKIEMMTQELVWMLRFDAVEGKCFVGEDIQIMCHDHVAAAYNCGGQHMTVVGVGQGKGSNQLLVPYNQTVTRASVHKVARPLKNDPAAMRLVLK
jgi:hypothetical protein